MSQQHNQQHPIVAEMLSVLDENQREHYEERASILVESAGLEDSLANAIALLEVVRLYGWPPSYKK